MAIALTTKSVTEYVLERERSLPKEEQTVWLLRPLSLAFRLQISELDGKSDGWQRAISSCLRGSLAGWRNFKDADGKDVPFATESAEVLGLRVPVASPESLLAIPSEDALELGARCLANLKLSVDDRKN